MRRGVATIFLILISFSGFVIADEHNETLLPDFLVQGTPIFKGDESNLSDGFAVALGKNYRIDFRAEGAKYNLQVNNFSEESVFITVYSGEFVYELEVDSPNKIDLDRDEYYELEINVSKVWINRVDLEIYSINESTTYSVVEVNITNETEIEEEDPGFLDELFGIEEEEAEIVESSNLSIESTVNKDSNLLFNIFFVILLILVPVVASAVLFKDDLKKLFGKK